MEDKPAVAQSNLTLGFDSVADVVGDRDDGKKPGLNPVLCVCLNTTILFKGSSIHALYPDTRYETVHKPTSLIC